MTSMRRLKRLCSRRCAPPPAATASPGNTPTVSPIFSTSALRRWPTRDERGADAPLATLSVYAALLAAFPDSHIARKHGLAAAETVRGEAARFEKTLKSAEARPAAFELALEFDRALKQRRLNPGTSADLTVAVLFADYLAAILASPRKNG